MDFQRDYIMRMIHDMVRFIGHLLTGKELTLYELDETVKATMWDDIYTRLIKLSDSGKINEAENLLYEDLDPNNQDFLLMGLSFYAHINEYTDDFLDSHDYSREEISQGIENLSAEYGVTGLGVTP